MEPILWQITLENIFVCCICYIEMGKVSISQQLNLIKPPHSVDLKSIYFFYVGGASISAMNLLEIRWTVERFSFPLFHWEFRTVNVKSDSTIMWSISLCTSLQQRLHCFACCSTWSGNSISMKGMIFSNSTLFGLHNWTSIRIHCDFVLLLQFGSNEVRHALFSLKIYSSNVAVGNPHTTSCFFYYSVTVASNQLIANALVI